MSTPSWEKHNELVRRKELSLSAPLAKAFEYIPEEAKLNAADLGCGSGADTIAMLDKGWWVLAVDKDPGSLTFLKQLNSKNLITSMQVFENLLLPKLDLVNASMSLPFCKPDYFEGCWQTIVKALSDTGYFCGHFFGPRDSWSGRPEMTFLTAEAVLDLFDGFDLLWMTETEKDGKTVNGNNKHWHVFSVAARKS